MRQPVLRTALAAVLLSAPVLAQHIVFEEAFEAGIPPTWTNIQLAYQGDIWQPGLRLVDGTRDVNHEWFCDFAIFFRDNILLSPPIDLTGVNQAYVEFGQWQIFPLSRLYNAVEITTDGGANYTPVYQEMGTWSGFRSTKVNITAFAGQSNVQVAFHYKGVVANDWSIDNVRVTTSALFHQVTNLVQGQTSSFAVTGGVPGNSVLVALSPFAGPIPTPWGNLNLSIPIITLPTLTVDANGRAATSVPVPPGLAGVRLYGQVMEFGFPLGSVVNISNSLSLIIQ